MTERDKNDEVLSGPVDYEATVDLFERALIHTLRKHSIAASFLDYWVPDADPVLGISGMVDSAGIAGLKEIEIEFSHATLPEDRLGELERALAKNCRATLESKGDRMLLRAAAIGTHTAGEESKPATRPKAKYWQAGADGAEGGTIAAGGWDDDRLPEYSDVHPRLRQALAATPVGLESEAHTTAVPGDRIEVAGSEEGWTLRFQVDPKTRTVCRAFHEGATTPATRAVLELYCRAAEGLPIQEAADHVGLKVIEALTDEDQGRPVPGILLPVNAGEPFMLADRLARQAYDSFRAGQGIGAEENFYHAPPSKDWRALSQAGRLERIATALNGFLQSEGLYPDDIEILKLEKNRSGYETRIVIAFSDRVAVAAKPGIMRRLESRMRRDIEKDLELIADRVKDSSPLRRLS